VNRQFFFYLLEFKSKALFQELYDIIFGLQSLEIIKRAENPQLSSKNPKNGKSSVHREKVEEKNSFNDTNAFFIPNIQ